MSRVIVKDLKVRDLPRDLTAGLEAAPEDVVRVTVDAERRDLVNALIALADRIGAEATQRGLTDERLDELLKR